MRSPSLSLRNLGLYVRQDLVNTFAPATKGKHDTTGRLRKWR